MGKGHRDRQKYGEVQRWGPHHTDKAQTLVAGGGFHNSVAAGMCRRRLSWQGAPVHPSSALPCSPHIVLPGRQVGGGAPQQLQIRGLSHVLFGAAVGAKTPNSGGTEQHRSTIALAGSLRPKKASVEAHQAAGDQSTSYNLLITSLKCVSVTDRPKTFVRPLTSLLLCCARTTAHVAVFRVRQQRNLHLGSHIKLLALFLKLSLILCTKESSQIQPAYT